MGGGGGKGLVTKKKYLFLKLEKKNQKNFVATKLKGGGGKTLVAGPLKKYLFLRGFPKSGWLMVGPVRCL